MEYNDIYLMEHKDIYLMEHKDIYLMEHKDTKTQSFCCTLRSSLHAQPFVSSYLCVQLKKRVFVFS